MTETTEEPAQVIGGYVLFIRFVVPRNGPRFDELVQVLPELDIQPEPVFDATLTVAAHTAVGCGDAVLAWMSRARHRKLVQGQLVRIDQDILRDLERDVRMSIDVPAAADDLFPTDLSLERPGGRDLDLAQLRDFFDRLADLRHLDDPMQWVAELHVMNRVDGGG